MVRGWDGENEGMGEGRRNGAMESIRRYARLNERNVNHKKLRAFKSPTRWCTFALITLHLSFLPRATLSRPEEGEGRPQTLREENFLSPSHTRPCFCLFISVSRSSSHARSLICIPRKRISPGPFRVFLSLSFSLAPFLFLLFSLSRMAALSLVETPRRE